LGWRLRSSQGCFGFCWSDNQHVEISVHVAVALFFFEDEIGGCGSGGEFDPVGDVGRDVGDLSGVQDDLFTSVEAGANGFSGAGAIGVLLLHGAAGDEGNGSLQDDHLVGPELVALGAAGVNAHDEESAVVAEVIHGLGRQTGWAGLCGSEEFGFVLLEVGRGVGGGLSCLS
jgi:hypothetical protein